MGKAKFDFRIVTRIRKIKENTGMSDVELSVIFGVTQSTITRIISNTRWITGQKRCRTCKCDIGYKFTYCTSCYFEHERTRRNGNSREWRKRRKLRDPIVWKKRLRISRLKQQYGISLREYYRILVVQDFKCAVCFLELELCVDHNHITNRVRGLLCRQCNTAIGLLRDDPDIIDNASKYLRLHKERH